MSLSSMEVSAVNVQECTTQRQYMRHRFLRTVQKQAPWLALASICAVLAGFPYVVFPAAYSLRTLQSMSYLLVMMVSLTVVLGTWRELRFARWMTAGVLGVCLIQSFLARQALAEVEPVVNHSAQIATDALMAVLVTAACILSRFQWSRCSQAVLSIVILMPVNSVLAFAYDIPNAYGQLSLLTSVSGFLCALALLAQQISLTPMSYLFLLDDTGKHLRWIVCMLFTCAIMLGGVGVLFGHDPRMTPVLITLALIFITSIMTFTYYRKGVMHDQVLPPEDLAFASELEAAIAHQEFYLLYQPQIDFQTGQLIGVEALIRWQHPEQGVVSPNKFIGVAELTGLIVPMGAWVLKAACQQVASWRDPQLGSVKVSVNVSPLQLRSDDFTSLVLQVLRETGLSAERLVIELTESAFIHSDCKSIENLQALKKMGVKLAIDDFGTGYSCLAYLRDIPGDYLKVDRAFVNDVPGKERSEAVTSAIVVLGKNLHYKIVAEGVETQAQADYLKALGCDYVQGYLYARPMSADKLLEWCQQAKPA